MSHQGIDAAGPQPGIHAEHGALDDVRGRALQGGVDGRALRRLALLGAAGVDLPQVQAAPENRLNEALLVGQLACFVM